MDNEQTAKLTAIYLRKIGFFFRRAANFISSFRFGYQIGMVFHDRSIHLSLIRRSFFHSRVVDTFIYPIDESAVNDWNMLADAAVSILIDFMRERKLRRAPINVGLLNEDIAFRRLFLPIMSSKELNAAIHWEGEKLFPFPFDQSIVVASVEPAHLSTSSDRFAINITAVKEAIVNILYDRFLSAGLRIGQVGFLPNMLVSNLPNFGASFSAKNTLLIYLGGQYSMALFVRNGVLEFFQQFVTRPITAIDDETQIENREAIIAELVSFIDLYDGHNRGNPLDNIIVCGPYSGDQTVVEAIGGRIGLPCRSMEFHRNKPIGVDALSLRARLDVLTVGLSSPGHQMLVPTDIRRMRDRQALVYRIGAVTVLSLLATASLHLHMSGQFKTREDSLAKKQAIVSSYEQSPAYQTYLDLMGKVQLGKRYLNAESDEPKSAFHVVLKEVSLSLPRYITLTALNLEKSDTGHELIMEGYVRIDEFSPEIVLAEYVESLGALPFFSNVTVSHHQKRHDRDRDDLMFQLTMDTQV
jgi:Tfp pilus assembly PilM family ATPase